MTPQQRIQGLSSVVREAASFYEQAVSNGRYQEAAKHMAAMFAALSESAAHLRGSFVIRTDRGEPVMAEPVGDKPPEPERYWDGVDVAAFDLVAGELARLPEPEGRHYDLGKRRPLPQQQRPQVGRVGTTPPATNTPGANK